MYLIRLKNLDMFKYMKINYFIIFLIYLKLLENVVYNSKFIKWLFFGFLINYIKKINIK